MLSRYLKLIVLLLLNNLLYTHVYATPIYAHSVPSTAELEQIGEKIFKNETGGKRDNLLFWSPAEPFPSLGIGHFIWFTENNPATFEETFPSLIKFYKEQGVKLPPILQHNKFAPWENREDFLEFKKSPSAQNLENFLFNTKDIQVLFIYQRLEKALDKILSVSHEPKHVKFQFYRVASSKGGYYALIDYVSFKGEGTNEKERSANGEGWGLLQVLENMQGKQAGESALVEFSQMAYKVLKNRAENSENTAQGFIWLKGWKVRVDSYKDIN